MGGSVGGAIKNTFSNPVRGGAAVMTFGTSELANKALGGRLFNTGGNTPAQVGQQDPLTMLTQSGGAPLLTSIALGVKPDDALASYFGVSPTDWPAYKGSLSASEQSAINGLSSTLTDISTNTDLKNQAVNKLVTDFPNYMADAVPKYANIMDDATKKMMDTALAQVSAKQAAGGAFSSGATAAATARAGAGIAEDVTKYGTDLALQDWQQKYNSASALQSFQQKMLGQGATQGFNAIQNSLSRNSNSGMFNADVVNQNNRSNQSSTNAMLGAAGTLAGTALFGPTGGAAVKAATDYTANGQSGQMASPRLNLSMPGGY